MSIVYLNGEYLPIEEAKISALDRGFLFSDSVYEVVPIYQSKPFYLDEHLQRLQQSLTAINLKLDMSNQDWYRIIDDLCEKNTVKDASLYIQVTRGAQSDRKFNTPAYYTPTVFVQITPIDFPDKAHYAQGFKAITTADIRWSKPYIKSTALLANILIYQEAHQRGVDDAILLRDGCALEGPASNLFIVSNGIVITPPAHENILHGITRSAQLKLMQEKNIPYEERIIPEIELMAAEEIWLSSSTMEIRPIVQLDGISINGGKPGPIWGKLFDLYEAYKKNY